jgi:glycerophosphoryl diester phosphodiesterase
VGSNRTVRQKLALIKRSCDSRWTPEFHPVCHRIGTESAPHADAAGGHLRHRIGTESVPYSAPTWVFSSVTLVIAHRGASRAERENTLAAFTKAVELGADLVELDVRLTTDGALAVHHDAQFADGRTIRDLAAADLPPDVPLLAAALDACRPLRVNVEIKNLAGEPGYDPTAEVAGIVADLIRERDQAARIIVSSFDLATLDRFHVEAPQVETAYLVNLVGNVSRLLATLDERGHHGLHPWHRRVTRRLVERCHAAGVAVRPWTVDDPRRIAALAALEVDAICTNVPDVALAVLRGGPA